MTSPLDATHTALAIVFVDVAGECVLTESLTWVPLATIAKRDTAPNLVTRESGRAALEFARFLSERGTCVLPCNWELAKLRTRDETPGERERADAFERAQSLANHDGVTREVYRHDGDWGDPAGDIEGTRNYRVVKIGTKLERGWVFHGLARKEIKP